jgi:nucleoside 2-deoxyribosyltransferase
MNSRQATKPGDEIGVVRVYLASRFARRDEMREVASELEASGFIVVSRWLGSPAPLSADDLNPGGPASSLAEMDLEDLRRADLCIAFTEATDHPKPGRGGRHTELGIAVGLGLEIMIVGPREHVFHALPEVRQYPNWQAARERLPEAGRRSARLVAI